MEKFWSASKKDFYFYWQTNSQVESFFKWKFSIFFQDLECFFDKCKFLFQGNEGDVRLSLKYGFGGCGHGFGESDGFDEFSGFGGLSGFDGFGGFGF